MLLYILSIIVCFVNGQNNSNEYDFQYIGEKEYEQAVDECFKLNLSLIRSDTEKIGKALYNYSLSINSTRYWIDLNIIKYNFYRHFDGTIPEHNFWAPGYPYYKMKLECVIGGYNGNWMWSMSLCNVTASTICTKNKQSMSEEYGLISLGHLRYRNADKRCFDYGYTTIKPVTDYSREIIFNFMKSNEIEEIWIDPNTVGNENVWTHYDRTPESNIILFQDTPNKERCKTLILSYPSWSWQIRPCNKSYHIICEHKYLYIGRYSYYQAIEECSKRGLYLPKADTYTSLNALVHFLNNKANKPYWIDVNNFNNHTEWVYMNGIHVIDPFWIPGEPKMIDKKHCVVSNIGKIDEGMGWWTHDCDSSANTICELNLLSIGEYKFEQAHYECFKRGLTLVRADTEKSAKILHNFARARSLNFYWIDATYLFNGSRWVHYDRTLVPNNLWERKKVIINEGDCVHGSPNENTWKWRNCFCLLKLDTVCEKRSVYIGEYTYDEANNECLLRGLNLARADTTEAAKALYNYAITISSRPYWIDATYSLKEGLWKHYDKSPASNILLEDGKSNEVKGNHCAIGNGNKNLTSINPWKWTHSKCDVQIETICV